MLSLISFLMEYTINLLFEFELSWNYLIWSNDRLISILIHTCKIRNRLFWFEVNSLFLWWKAHWKLDLKKNLTFDWSQIFAKENYNAAMLVISQQIFDKRHDHNLLKCYKQRQFHQILELRTQSRENLPWIHPFTRPDTLRRKNLWYN